MNLVAGWEEMTRGEQEGETLEEKRREEWRGGGGETEQAPWLGKRAGRRTTRV